jgi:hemerythrin-like domain-containing protein
MPGRRAEAGGASSKLIGILKEDHNHFAVLLDALDRQADLFADGEAVDYELLETGISYLRAYAHAVHHPLEEAILERLSERAADDGLVGRELSLQHERLEDSLKLLQSAFHDAGEDQSTLRQPLAEALHRMVSDMRAHNVWEEANFFPAAGRALGAQDWAQLSTGAEGQAVPAARPLDPRFSNLLQQLGCSVSADGE